MTQAKQVAKTLKSVLEDPMMKQIMNLEIIDDEMEPIITEIKDWWDYDLYNRKPGPAYKDGVFVGTDLDLACFIYALCGRKAVINIPEYTGMAQKSIKEGERVTSSKNRNGRITSLSSNKDFFSFGFRIHDENVETDEEQGKPRTYNMTDYSGEWYEGWTSVQFSPTAKENKFLTENKLWTDNKVMFKNFTHPNRWTSFYGKYYFITKKLIERLKMDSSYFKTQIKKILDDGIKYPSGGEPKEWPKSYTKGGKSVKFKVMQVELDTPDYIGEYPEYKCTVGNLVKLTRLSKAYTYSIIPRLSFAVRATELAFFKYGKKEDGTERMPGWLKGGVVWERDYVQKGKRTKWDRLVFGQPGVGQVGFGIRKREFEKSKMVSEDYVEK